MVPKYLIEEGGPMKSIGAVTETEVGHGGATTLRVRDRWSETRWERLAPLSGIVAVILFVVGFLVFEVVGDTPGSDLTASEYLAYFQTEETSIWVGSWIFLLGIPFFLWFLASLRGALERALGGAGKVVSLVYAGGVGVALLVAAALGTQISGAIAANDNANLSPQTAETLWWAGDGFMVGAFFFLATFLAATAIAAFRTRVLPLWFGIVTVILAVAAAVPFVGWAVLIFAMPLWIIFVAILLSTREAGLRERESADN